MADPSVGAFASFHAEPSFGQLRNAWLEELIRGDAEEVSDAIQIGELNFAFSAQEIANPHVAMVAPLREIVL